MSSTEQRQILLPLIERAMQGGARLHNACAQIGLSARTVQHWLYPCATAGDRRVNTLRAKAASPNKLGPVERDTAMRALNSSAFKDLPPSQIVP